MTLDLALKIGLSLVGGGLVLLCVIGLFLGSKPREAEEADATPKPKRTRGRLADGFCPVCRQPGVYLTKAGQPNRRYHRCEPAAVQTHVWPDVPREVAP